MIAYTDAGRRPPPVRYVTTQEKVLTNRPVPGRLSNSPEMCKSLISYIVSFICDHSIICVPIFTMQTSVVVDQWLERSPCLLIVRLFYCVDFNLTFGCSTHNCFLDFSYECLYNDGEYRKMVMLNACYCHYINF